MEDKILTGSNEESKESKWNTRITVHIYHAYRVILEYFVRMGKYPSMSEAIRQALELWINKEMEKDDKIRLLLAKIKNLEMMQEDKEKKIQKEDEFLNELF